MMSSFHAVTLNSSYIVETLPAVEWGHNLYPIFLPYGGYWEILLKVKADPQGEDNVSIMLRISAGQWFLHPEGFCRRVWVALWASLPYPWSSALFHTGPPCQVIRLRLMKVL